MRTSRPADSFFRALASQRLTLAVLLGLAVLAAAGTALSKSPAEPARGIPFVLLVAAGIVNISACTWRRSVGRWGAPGRTRVAVDVLLHASLLLVIAGGATKALFGFVGTQNIHVGGWTGTMYEWKSGRDVPLGFDVGIEQFQQEFHPLRARVGVRRAATGEKVGLVEIGEKRWEVFAGGDLRIRIAGYDPAAAVVVLEAESAGVARELAFGTRGSESPSRTIGAYELSLVAYRADVKRARARVVFREGGRVVGGSWIGPNETVRHRGTGFFLTGWGSDAFGNGFCGLQSSRDPGAAAFWIGSVALAAATISLAAMKRGPRLPGRNAPAPQERPA